MLKYLETMVTFSEFPTEVALCINISGCPIKCPDCHSKQLWEDVGTNLTISNVVNLIEQNKGISLVGLMGGDADSLHINAIASYIKDHYPDIKVGWYSGKPKLSKNIILRNFDYIKLGPYIKDKGGLDSKTTNQRFYKVINNTLVDSTNLFWK